MTTTHTTAPGRTERAPAAPELPAGLALSPRPTSTPTDAEFMEYAESYGETEALKSWRYGQVEAAVNAYLARMDLAAMLDLIGAARFVECLSATSLRDQIHEQARETARCDLFDALRRADAAPMVEQPVQQQAQSKAPIVERIAGPMTPLEQYEYEQMQIAVAVSLSNEQRKIERQRDPAMYSAAPGIECLDDLDAALARGDGDEFDESEHEEPAEDVPTLQQQPQALDARELDTLTADHTGAALDVRLEQPARTLAGEPVDLDLGAATP